MASIWHNEVISCSRARSQVCVQFTQGSHVSNAIGRGGVHIVCHIVEENKRCVPLPYEWTRLAVSSFVVRLQGNSSVVQQRNQMLGGRLAIRCDRAATKYPEIGSRFEP